MIKRFGVLTRFTIALALLLSSLSSLTMSPVVNATSDYDNVIWRQSNAWLPIYQQSTGLYTYRDVSTTWYSLIPSGAAKNSFDYAQAHGGHWMLVNFYDGLSIIWSSDTSTKTSFFMKYGQPSWGINNTASEEWNIIRLYEQNGSINQITYLTQTNQNIILFGNKPNPLPSAPGGLVFSNYETVSVTGYEGDDIPGDEDTDGDGLSFAQESTQGTSDTDEDTDNDGLNDLVESRWYADRASVFCGISECAYPDPVKKDLYVEIDWMDDGVDEYKPSSAQIELVQDAFEAKDVYLHVDTGQFGGGDALPTYIEALKFEPVENETDFYNFKNDSMTFAADRRNIWHYMITGDRLYDGDDNDGSGISYNSDDDSFIALGQVARSHPLSQNQAIAGTIIHELGHNLCLSKNAYTGQDPLCLFGGIDTYASSDYDSVMNYNKQFSLVDYSEGLNGVGDHNDWAAILVGMDDFATIGGDPVEPSLGAKVAFDRKPTYETTSTEELHEATERQKQSIIQERVDTRSDNVTKDSVQGVQDASSRMSEGMTGKSSSSQVQWSPILARVGVLSAVIGCIIWYVKRK